MRLDIRQSTDFALQPSWSVSVWAAYGFGTMCRLGAVLCELVQEGKDLQFGLIMMGLGNPAARLAGDLKPGPESHEDLDLMWLAALKSRCTGPMRRMLYES